MTVNDWLSWVISILALVAVWALTRKFRWAWVFYFIAQILSMWLYFRLSLWGLFWVNIIFAYFSVDGFIRWKNKSE